MKTTIITAILALGLAAGTFGGQAQADEIVWHFPYKGAPYATRVATPRNVVSERRKTLHSLWCAKGDHLVVRQSSRARR